MGNLTLTKNETSRDPYDPLLDSDIIANSSFINDIWLIKPTSQIIIETTIFLPVVLLGLFGNVLSIYVLLKNRYICTPSNLLIGNMAAADLLSLLMHPWVILVYDFFQNYQLGGFGCKAEGAFECSIMLTSVITLSAISYDRLTAIILPKESRLTKNRAKIVIVVTWITGLLISAPLFFYRTYKERRWKDFLEQYCTENSIITNIYWHVIITVLVWLPLTFQLICYISIFVKLYKYEKIVLRKMVHRQVDYKKKAVRMMSAIILTFLICRLPFTALIIYRNQSKSTLSSSSQVQNTASGSYHTFWFVSKFFIFLNAALNPLIYSLTNDKFQKGFKTTKLSKWLFPPERNKTLKIIHKEHPKNETLETPSFFIKNLLYIFKIKPKPVTVVTTISAEMSKAKYDGHIVK